MKHSFFYLFTGLLMVQICQAQERPIARSAIELSGELTSDRGLKHIDLWETVKVDINCKSFLQYMQFNGIQELKIKGEAYIEMESTDTDSTLTVEADGLGSISCRNNAHIDIKNYREDSCLVVTIYAGSALLILKDATLFLRAGERGIIQGNVIKREINSDQNKSPRWINGFHYYEGEKLAIIANGLQRHYDSRIIVVGPARKFAFTLILDMSKNLEENLRHIVKLSSHALYVKKLEFNHYEIGPSNPLPYWVQNHNE